MDYNEESMLKLYNTLTRKKETFKPLKKGRVGLYTCGITAYWYPHIGNLRTYLFEDVLKRVLLYNGYKVKHVMNITDVGHLTSDADTGEDKLEKGAKREKKTVWEIADFYTKHFKKDLKNLNIKEPSCWIKATDTIKEQIDLIKVLEKKGFTYTIEDGVYFDTSKIKDYGQLWGSKKPVELKAGARIEMVKGKKHPTDFALWKFTPKGVKRQMEWDSPWKKGFPGWHTECVVMSARELGAPFDIHTGGIDHIPVHHTNEIAQAEAAFGNILANYWLHGEFLVMKENPEGKPSVSDGARMSKSKGNIIITDTLNEKGYCLLSYRYLCLTTHYRSKLTFTWESLTAAQNALKNLYEKVLELQPLKLQENSPKTARAAGESKYKKRFSEAINNDLNMPKAIALMWQMLNDTKLSNKGKYALLLDFDKVFGLGLGKVKKEKTPKKVLELVEKREQHRKNKEWKTADELRKKIEKMGYEVEDTEKGPVVKKSLAIR